MNGKDKPFDYTVQRQVFYGLFTIFPNISLSSAKSILLNFKTTTNSAIAWVLVGRHQPKWEKEGGGVIAVNIKYNQNIKLSMLQAKLKRKIRAQSKLKNSQNKNQLTALPPKVNLRKLSFSFYAQDTIRNNKQVILDNCDLLNQIPDIPLPLSQSYHKAKPSLKSHSLLAPSKRKDSLLKMEGYFLDGKCDQIDLVPTNASHYDPKERQSSAGKKKQKSRASSVKFKEANGELKMGGGGLGKNRCKTACKVGKKPRKQ